MEKKEKTCKDYLKQIFCSWDNNRNTFFLTIICIFSAYMIQRDINYEFYNKSNNYYDDNFNYIFILTYAISYIISICFYISFSFYVEVIQKLIKKEEDIIYENKEVGKLSILGFLLYCEKKSVNNDSRKKNNFEKEKQIISEINNEKEKSVIIYEQDNEFNRNQKIHGEQSKKKFKKEKVSNKNKNKKKIGLFDKNDDFICDYIKNEFPCYYCYKNCNKYTCATCKLGFKKCYEKSKNTALNKFCFYESCNICKCCEYKECCYCCPCCQKCCECCNYLELTEEYQEEEIICVAYNVQRKCSWFCDLLFKNNLISLIYFNIMAEIGIIGFEKGINEKLETQNIDEGVEAMVIFFYYFLIWAFYNTISYCWTKLTADNYAFYYYLFLFHLFNSILSGIFYFNKNKMKNLGNNYRDAMLCSLSYTKFMNFLITDNFIDEMDENNNSLLKHSFVVTFFSLIYDFIIFFIDDVFNCNSENLILFQFIFGCVYITYDIIQIIIFFYDICNRKKYK